VLYASGREPGRSAAVTETLGKVGVYLPPTYLGVKYETGPQRRDLYEILRAARSESYGRVQRRERYAGA
jgi:hypothetical protein